MRKIIQTVSNEKRQKQGLKKIGRGDFEAYRLNPFNPLSYLTVIITLIYGVVCFGIIGFWKEIDSRNPFKWN